MKKSTIRKLYLIALPAQIILSIFMLVAFLQYAHWRAKQDSVFAFSHIPHVGLVVEQIIDSTERLGLSAP